MTKCVFCKKPILPDVKAASIVGGYYPSSDPDFFMMDEETLAESHAHLRCLLEATSGQNGGGKPA